MRKVYVDTETCGLHSMCVLVQYAFDGAPVTLHDVWLRPVAETLRLIESFTTCCVVGFNLAFDWFHLNKLYTVFSLCDPTWIPQEHIEEIAALEARGRDQRVIKPAAALDLFLHSRRGPYQNLMAREDIRIRKVPTVLAEALARELEERVSIDGIFFAKSANPDAPKWKVDDRRDQNGDYDPDFKDVRLTFRPGGGLKFLAEHAFGEKPKYKYDDVEPSPEWRPYELGYAPFAAAVSSSAVGWSVEIVDKSSGAKKVRYAWPAVIQRTIDHWATNDAAREYARDDVTYTRRLEAHFGFPAIDDDDSVLACMVGVVRWRGFEIDLAGIRELRDVAHRAIASSPVNVNSPKQVREFIASRMTAEEAISLIEGTSKKRLKKLANAFTVSEDEPCGRCQGDLTCQRCRGTGVLEAGRTHPAADAIKQVLAVRAAMKELELYDKLLLAGRLHASFKVIGTLSNRMSGADGLNPQGINKKKTVRNKFPLAWIGSLLCGGDFDSFEVTLADAVYADPNLRNALLTKVDCHKCKGTGRRGDAACEDCEGVGRTTQKIHALFAMGMYPGTTYGEIMASDGAAVDMYNPGKIGVFTLTYGGNWATLMKNLDVPEEIAKAADEAWITNFPGIGHSRKRIEEAFCSMRQPGGIGTAVEWHDPAEYVESFLGFRRYFTLENKIVKALFDLARRPPAWWRGVDVKVVRRDRVQTAGGAVSSALYAASFGLQAANMRAAANHEIQSPGGEITKRVQRRIWDHQPAGVHELIVAPMNVHDEIMCPTHPDYVDAVGETIRDTVESYRAKVPLIGMTWFKRLANWADKKSGSDRLKICAPEMALAA